MTRRLVTSSLTHSSCGVDASEQDLESKTLLLLAGDTDRERASSASADNLESLMGPLSLNRVLLSFLSFNIVKGLTKVEHDD